VSDRTDRLRERRIKSGQPGTMDLAWAAKKAAHYLSLVSGAPLVDALEFSIPLFHLCSVESAVSVAVARSQSALNDKTLLINAAALVRDPHFPDIGARLAYYTSYYGPYGSLALGSKNDKFVHATPLRGGKDHFVAALSDYGVARTLCGRTIKARFSVAGKLDYVSCSRCKGHDGNKLCVRMEQHA